MHYRPLLAALLAGVCCLSVRAQAAPDPLAKVEQLARTKGASQDRLGEKHGKLAKNGADALTLKLAPKQCAIAAASVDESVPDVSLTIDVKDGPKLADETSGPAAVLRYCAGLSEEKLTLRVKSEKATNFALGVWGVAGSDVQGVDPQAKSAGSASAEATNPTLGSLSKRLQGLSSKRAAGFSVMAPVREEDVSTAEPRQREVVLAADQCYRVLAVAEPADVEVELALADSKGNALGSVHGKLEITLPDIKAFCPKAGGPHKVSVRSLAGSGRVAWQLFGASNPELEARWPIGGKGEQLVATRVRDIHRNQGAKGAVMEFESGQLGTNEVHTSHFGVVGGRCYLAVAAGLPSLRALEVEILDQRGNTIAHSQEQNSISVQRVCADLSGTWTMRAKAFKGYGAFGVQVFGAPDQP